MTVSVLGRLRLTLFPFTALWRTVDGGVPRRAAAMLADAIGPWTLRAGGVNNMGMQLLKDRVISPVDAVAPHAGCLQ